MAVHLVRGTLPATLGALISPHPGDTFDLTLIHFALASGCQIPSSEGTGVHFPMDIYIPTFNITDKSILEDLAMDGLLSDQWSWNSNCLSLSV